MVAVGEELAGDGADRVLDLARPNIALYVGGMGARDKNFYNTIASRYGYVDEAAEIQDLYLSGRKDEAAAAVPRALLAGTNLVGPESHVAERIAAYREAGVTHLSVNPVGPDPVKTIETLRSPHRLTPPIRVFAHRSVECAQGDVRHSVTANTRMGDG